MPNKDTEPRLNLQCTVGYSEQNRVVHCDESAEYLIQLKTGAIPICEKHANEVHTGWVTRLD